MNIKLMCRNVLALACFFCSIALAEVLVIVHPSNSSTLDQEAIQRIYLGKITTFPNGEQAVPLDLQEESAVRNRFTEEVLKRSPSQLKSYWAQQLFTGKGTPPKVLENDTDVISLVKANPNIIGYISSGAPTDGVKVIGSF